MSPRATESVTLASCMHCQTPGITHDTVHALRIDMACAPCARREMEDVEPVPGDHWATREFHVKWRRWSYIHCSWDTRETLAQLGGYKRVLNYMKRTDELEARRLIRPACPCMKLCGSCTHQEQRAWLGRTQ